MRIEDSSIRTRLMIASLAVALLIGTGFLGWSGRRQGEAAVAQAKDFATSVHQMTLAGLTGMMITGNAADRGIFLDQILQSNHVRSLRVLRSEAITAQFGSGRPQEDMADPEELEVMRMRAPYYQVVEELGSARLRAVLPIVASSSYLGKNCLACHDVREGTVLGAVSMEISLASVQAAASRFNRDAALVALGLLVPFSFLIWFSIGRLVTTPLTQLTRGLHRIAEGDVAACHALEVRGKDEVGRAAAAFNRVMARVMEMLRALRLSRTVFDNAMEAITVTDAAGRIQMVNQSFVQVTGYEPDEVIGKTPAVLKSGRHDVAFYERFWTSLKDEGRWSGEIWNKRRDGTVYPEWLSVVAVRDPQGETENFIGIFADITERKRREEEIAFKAFHDALTGLPNRITLTTRLQQALALAGRRGHPAPSVLYIDLDRFKVVNDQLGHEVGDGVLIEAAGRLKGCVRESDTVARLGGDEFVVLLPETSEAEGLQQVCGKILTALEGTMHIGTHRIHVSASIGVATYPQDGRDPKTLLGSADSAMYRVKGSGRSGFALASEDEVTLTR